MTAIAPAGVPARCCLNGFSPQTLLADAVDVYLLASDILVGSGQKGAPGGPKTFVSDLRRHGALGYATSAWITVAAVTGTAAAVSVTAFNPLTAALDPVDWTMRLHNTSFWLGAIHQGAGSWGIWNAQIPAAVSAVMLGLARAPARRLRGEGDEAKVIGNAAPAAQKPPSTQKAT